jgi:hypothetical protein
LGSVTFACIFGLSLIAFRIWDIVVYQRDLRHYYSGVGSKIIRYTPPFQGGEAIALIFCISLYFLLLFTVGILFLWQLYYLFGNVTTIESYENIKINDLQNSGMISKSKIYPYNLGPLSNFKFLFGEKVWLWWLPLPAKGDGVTFKKSLDISWPPKEYYLHKKYPNGKCKKSDRFIKKTAEGLVVPRITSEDREKMLNGTYEPPKLEYDDSSTDYDSLDDEIYDSNETDSDKETLFHRQARLKK